MFFSVMQKFLLKKYALEFFLEKQSAFTTQ